MLPLKLVLPLALTVVVPLVESAVIASLKELLPKRLRLPLFLISVVLPEKTESETLTVPPLFEIAVLKPW